jgi:hypothetical protein
MRQGFFFPAAWSIAALFLLLCPAAAQSPPPSRTETPYLLPQTIFVGDQGRLVVPLGQAFAALDTFVLDIAGDDSQSEVLKALPENSDLLIQRIELERRGGASRLLIDFIPYAPGVLNLPPLNFSSSGSVFLDEESPASNYLKLSGLEVQVASILTQSQMVLAEPAPPLSVPGTSFLVYGSIILVLIFLFLGIGFSFWGSHHFKDLWNRIRRRHLIRVMQKFLRRLRQESCQEKNGNPAYFLSLLAGEFREFLSYFTGVNCRSFSAVEFHSLPLGYSADMSAPPSSTWQLFLCDLFRNWDDLRFSGRGIKMIDLFSALKETEKFIIALDREEREKSLFTAKASAEKPADAALVTAGGGESP